jgi:hypothetical protein
MHLFYNELEVRYNGIIKLECFKFKLQKSKLVRLDRMWKKYRKWKVKQEDLKYNLVPKCCLMQTICRIEHLKSLVLGTYWLPSKLQTHSIASTRQVFDPC